MDREASQKLLKLLEADRMIELKRASKWTMLTICKYESYNNPGQADDVSKGNQTGNQGAIKGQQLNKEKECKERKEDVNRREMKKESEYKNETCKHYSISFDEYDRQLDIFAISNDMKRSINEIQKHFFSWLKYQELIKHKTIVPHYNSNLKINTGGDVRKDT
jgi:hypothetical protein